MSVIHHGHVQMVYKHAFWPDCEAFVAYHEQAQSLCLSFVCRSAVDNNIQDVGTLRNLVLCVVNNSCCCCTCRGILTQWDQAHI